MLPQVCSICRGISGDFWSPSYDTFEARGGTKARLQSYNNMKKQSGKGCQLCTLLLDSLKVERLKDRDACVYLWRDYWEPERAFGLSHSEKKYAETLGLLYFFRVPVSWCEYW